MLLLLHYKFDRRQLKNLADLIICQFTVGVRSGVGRGEVQGAVGVARAVVGTVGEGEEGVARAVMGTVERSEENTSEIQSRHYIWYAFCRIKKK